MDWMARALELARSAVGRSSPNPAVGAVITHHSEAVGEGFTQPAGSWHAEVCALEQAGERARGGALYVTLEPCCHYGRTPPCTQAIIAAGIAEVHMAMLDPNPLVSGQGKVALEEAGIRTYLGEHGEEAHLLNEAYIKYITTGLPFVTAKFAMSLDGKIATRSGDSRWISSEEARAFVHQLRATTDAIMVGSNTVLCDDPQLTARLEPQTTTRQPLRVIVDSHGHIPPTAQVFQGPGKVLVATTDSIESTRERQMLESGAEVLRLPSREGFVDLVELLHALGQKEIISVLVEGGSTLLGSLFDQRLVDKVLAFIAPIIIGGREAVTAVGGQGAARMAEALQLSKVRVETFGQDLLVSGYPRDRRYPPPEG